MKSWSRLCLVAGLGLVCGGVRAELPAAVSGATSAPASSAPAAAGTEAATAGVVATPFMATSRDRAAATHGRERSGREGRLVSSSPAPQAVQGNGCDNGCLKGLVDTYLKAVVAHDPKLLPLADPIRFTETGQDLSLGDGFWNTASGIGGSQLYALDPVTQQAGFLGTMREFDHVVLMALRLKVRERRISEIETVFYRQGEGPAWSDAGVNDANARGVADTSAFAPLPPEARSSRESLIQVANAWLAALQGGSDRLANANADAPVATTTASVTTVTPASASAPASATTTASAPVPVPASVAATGNPLASSACVWFNNGAQVSSNPGVLIGSRDFNLAALNCQQQLQSGWYASNTRVHHRRVVAVDPQRGLAFVWANIDRAGLGVLQLTSGRVLAVPELQRPSSSAVVFALRIENGQVMRVVELEARTPYRMGSGWGE